MLEGGCDHIAKARATLNRFNFGSLEQIVGKIKCGSHKSILLLSCLPVKVAEGSMPDREFTRTEDTAALAEKRMLGEPLG